MIYSYYKYSRNLAWEILIKENICSLPVRMSALCRQMGIPVYYYEPADNNDGCSTIVNGQPAIFVSSLTSVERQRFTCAHELGHILSGDVGKYKLVNREPSPADNPVESRANVFASRLLAPAIVLHEMNVQSAAEISEICGISQTAARIRFERLKLLRARNADFIRERGYPCFGMSELERQVLRQFEPYIKQNML